MLFSGFGVLRIFEKLSGIGPDFFHYWQNAFEKKNFREFSLYFSTKKINKILSTKTLKKIQLSLLNEISSIQRRPMKRI